jgi:hypothetical protein
VRPKLKPGEPRLLQELAADRLLVGLITLDPAAGRRPEGAILRAEADE